MPPQVRARDQRELPRPPIAVASACRSSVPRAVELYDITVLSELPVPTSRGVAARGSSPLRPPREGSCRTSTAPWTLASIGREHDRPRRHPVHRPGIDRQPPRREQPALPAVRGDSPQPPHAQPVAPTCWTRNARLLTIGPTTVIFPASTRSIAWYPELSHLAATWAQGGCGDRRVAGSARQCAGPDTGSRVADGDQRVSPRPGLRGGRAGSFADVDGGRASTVDPLRRVPSWQDWPFAPG